MRKGSAGVAGVAGVISKTEVGVISETGVNVGAPGADVQALEKISNMRLNKRAAGRV
jgi:hypothetical protein